MSLSDNEEYTFSLRSCSSQNDLQSLTKQSLFFLNLEHQSTPSASSDSDNYNNYTSNDQSGTGTTTTGASTPQMVSSSSSSLASFDENSEDYKELSNFYGGDKNPNTSNSSIATLVQKLASSTSTLNLQPKALSNPSIFDVESPSELPQTPPNESNESNESNKAPRKIKSSLKLPGLTRSKSMPSTAPKTVRFSTVLTKVKTFNEHAKPSSISLDNSPESSSNEDDYYPYPSAPKAFFELKNSLNSPDESEDSEEDYFTYRSSAQRTKWNLKCLNFNLLSFQQSSNASPVRLVSLSIADNATLVGAVEVINIAFEKYVEVKFTTDDWKSIYLVTGKYDRTIDSSRDRFKFQINLNQSLLLGNKKASSPQKKDKSVNVGLCVRYVAGGSQTYYDNNNAENYKFELINQQRLRKSKSLASSSFNSSSFSSSSPPSSLRRTSSTLPSFTRDNFSSAEINTSPSRPDTLSSSTRYFSDDTDYFNGSSISANPVYNSWGSSSFDASKFLSSSSSTTSSASTTTNSSSTSVASSVSNGSRKPSSYTTNRSTQSRFSNNFTKPAFSSKDPQSYDDFLNKYCFFKSEDPVTIK